MSLVLIIAGWTLAAIAATTLVWHRRREHAARFAWARENDLELYSGRSRELMMRLRDLALLQIGHSRRLEAAFVLPGGGFAFCYACQTGFDQDRFLHAWIVTALEVEHDAARAVITAQDWLRAAAHATSRRTLPVNGVGAPGERIAIVEDAEGWRRRLKSTVGSWLKGQPSERSWELLPGWIVGYEPGSAEGQPLMALTAATKELAELLAGERSALDAAATAD